MKIERTIIHSGFDGKICLTHARPGVYHDKITGKPKIIIVCFPLNLSDSDVFYGMKYMISNDLGKTWSNLQSTDGAIDRRKKADNTEEIFCDCSPGWHDRTKTLLGTGHTAWYENDHLIRGRIRKRDTAYSIYDPEQNCWSDYKTLIMPDSRKFYNSGAGCTQRLDLPDGDILLPLYFSETLPPQQNTHYASLVIRCHYDGKTLTFAEEGNTLRSDLGRGLYEPSICQCGNQYYLTLRNDSYGFFCTSNDGLHFSSPRIWCFDNGDELGNYNTQQHWLAHEDRLFLIYTRKGANNDNVMRHRAPLFLAEVDREKMCVIRSSEQILVPNRGARLGNFGIAKLSEKEYILSVSEWMQTTPPNPFDYTICQKYGSDNSIFMVKISF